MKKIFLEIVALAMATSVFAIGPKYDANLYEALPVKINLNSDEFGLSAFRNNSLVYFRTDTTSKNGLENVEILKTAILPSGELSEPVACDELNGLGICGSFAYDKNADKIYYARYNKLKKVYQLYESTYADGQWSAPQIVFIKNLTPTRMGMIAIENASWDYLDAGASIVQPVLANEGNRLYFASNLKKGSKGKTDIWYIEKEGEDWGEPINLGDSINTKGKEQYPFVLGDSILYYATTGDNDEGGFDLRVARLTPKEAIDTTTNETYSYRESESLGELFNTSNNDFNLVNCADEVYFISQRIDEQKEDIVHLFALPQPEEITFASIEPVVAPQVETEPPFKYVLFHFDFDKSNMQKDTDADIELLFNQMQMFPDRRFVIAGHTDERGTEKYNEKLSLRRATTVRDVLVKKGIDKNKLVVKAYGESQLVVPNAQTEEEHAQNRRVEVNFYSEQQSNEK